ncbi:putative porin, partial [Bordetella hinzii]|nr:putative porin [Bordetella hinzii]
MTFVHTRTALALALALAAGPAAAQAPSDNATVNLIRLLVQQGVLKPDQADALLKQAEAEAQAARTTGGASQAQPGDVRVPYIPASVRAEIREEVKQEVVAQAKAENWAQPNTFPDWVSRITIDGDMRVRNESRFYDSRNSNEILDLARMNASGPFLMGTYAADGTFQPQDGDRRYLNTREDRRNLWRIRARLGIKAQLSEDWIAGIRLASGTDDSPVSTSDTLGNDMGKKNLWLDQAYLSWRAADWMTATAGRAANPFVSTDLLYSSDLNFDGLSAVFKKPLEGKPVTLFGTLGAFVLDYAKNGGTYYQGEGKSENKWLLGAQVGADWRIDESNRLRGALAYYHFDNIAGQRSSPCVVYSKSDVCSTDWSRPSFMQKGNTLFLLRDIVPSGIAGVSEYQYLGLASQFNLLDLNLQYDTRVFNGLGLRLAGNYVRNLAYKRGKMEDRAGGLNNIASNVGYDSTDPANPRATGIQSGPNAWMLQATL